MTETKQRVLEPLNAPALLEEILKTYWPERADQVGESREKTLCALRLSHPPHQTKPLVRQPCTRCGGNVYVQYSPKTSSWQCIRCRQKRFDRLGSPDAAAAALSIFRPRKIVKTLVLCSVLNCHFNEWDDLEADNFCMLERIEIGPTYRSCISYKRKAEERKEGAVDQPVEP